MLKEEIAELDAAKAAVRAAKSAHREISAKMAEIAGYPPAKPGKTASEDVLAAYEAAKAAYDAASNNEAFKAHAAADAVLAEKREQFRRELDAARVGFRKAVNAAVDRTRDPIQLGALACLMQAENLSSSRIMAKIRVYA